MTEVSKKALRDKLIQLRRNMPRALMVEESNFVNNRLIDCYKKLNFDCVVSYASKDDEVDLFKFHSKVWEDSHIYFPQIVKNFELTWQSVRRDRELVDRPFGLREPEEDGYKFEELDYINILVLVPGLGFSPNGARIGWGKGYYDRQIPIMKKASATIIGIGFSCQSCTEIPEDDHDQRLPMLLLGKHEIVQTS